jgi:hypothetical protein
MTSARKVVDSTKPFTFTITAKHIAKAVCRDPKTCVVAQAVSDAFGDVFESIEAGCAVTKVFTSDKIIRYATPGPMRAAIRIFDKTGRWPLAVGAYRLRAVRPAESLAGKKARNARRKLGKPRAKKGDTARRYKPRAIPTRKVSRADIGGKHKSRTLKAA